MRRGKSALRLGFLVTTRGSLGSTCPGGRNQVRWFAHPDGSPDTLAGGIEKTRTTRPGAHSGRSDGQRCGIAAGLTAGHRVESTRDQASSQPSSKRRPRGAALRTRLNKPRPFFWAAAGYLLPVCAGSPLERSGRRAHATGYPHALLANRTRPEMMAVGCVSGARPFPYGNSRFRSRCSREGGW